MEQNLQHIAYKNSITAENIATFEIKGKNWISYCQLAASNVLMPF